MLAGGYSRIVSETGQPGKGPARDGAIIVCFESGSKHLLEGAMAKARWSNIDFEAAVRR